MEQFFLESLEYVKNEIVRNRYSQLLHKCAHCAMNFSNLCPGVTQKIEMASTERVWPAALIWGSDTSLISHPQIQKLEPPCTA